MIISPIRHRQPATGSVKLKVLPLPTTLSTRMRPWWASTSSRMGQRTSGRWWCSRIHNKPVMVRRLWYTIGVRNFSLVLIVALWLCATARAPAPMERLAACRARRLYVQAGNDTVLARKIGAMARDRTPDAGPNHRGEDAGPFPIFAYTSSPDFLRATGNNPDLLGESMVLVRNDLTVRLGR